MRIILLILLVFNSFSAFAQGAFLAPMGEISELDGTISLGAGIGGGIQLKRWLLGAYGIYTSKAGRAGEGTSLHDLDVALGGLWLGYSQPASDFLLVNVGFKGAVGNARQKGIMDADLQSDRIWLLTPEAGVEVALGKQVRIGLTAGYRIPGNVQLSAFEQQDLRSLVNTLTIKIGKLPPAR